MTISVKVYRFMAENMSARPSRKYDRKWYIILFSPVYGTKNETKWSGHTKPKSYGVLCQGIPFSGRKAIYQYSL